MHSLSEVKPLKHTFFPDPVQVNLHKDQVASDPAYMADIDDKFLLPSQHAKKFAGSGDNDMRDFSRAQIKLHILHISDPLPVTNIDHFLFFQVTQTHIPPPLSGSSDPDIII